MSNKTFNGVAKLERVRSPSTDQVLKGWTGSGKAKGKGSREGAKEQREKQRVCMAGQWQEGSQQDSRAGSPRATELL